MSFLKRFLRSIYRSRHFVGRDLEGNRFYEYPSLGDDFLRTRRRVQYEDMWDYVGGARRLPVQWVSWLSHTRSDPPTLEELRADLERQQRVLHNAAVIQARDQEERARIAAASAPEGNEYSSRSTSQDVRTGKQDPSRYISGGLERPSSENDPRHASQPSHGPQLPPIGKDRDWQPEAWTPQTTRRRGG